MSINQEKVDKWIELFRQLEKDSDNEQLKIEIGELGETMSWKELEKAERIIHPPLKFSRKARMIDRMMNSTFDGMVFNHYKGKKYIGLGVGIHTETHEQMVIYVEHNSTCPTIFIRPLSIFFDEIEGKDVLRFEINEEETDKIDDMRTPESVRKYKKRIEELTDETADLQKRITELEDENQELWNENA